VKMHVITKFVSEDGEELPVQEISSSHSLELNTNVESWMKNLTEASH